jgi:hypothetical protein
MISILTAGILLAQSCSGPWCGPDTEYEHPDLGVVGNAAAPVVALASDGALVVAWEFRAVGAESDILVNRREPGRGGTWQDVPYRLDGDAWGAARSIEPRIAAGPDGRVAVVWQDARDGADALWLNRSTDDGVTWLGPRRLAPEAAGEWTASMASLAAGGGGELFLVWEDQRDGGRDLRFARSPDGGVTWEPDRRVDSDEPGAGTSYHPLLAQANGALLVSWWDERNGDADVYVRRSTDGGATWAGPEVRLDPGPAGAATSRDARISAAGANVTVVWEEGTARGDATILGRSSTDAGATWAAPVVYGEGQDPAVVARADGPPSVAWAARSAGRGPAERTSIGGRIVDIPVPVELQLTEGTAIGTGGPPVRNRPGLDAHEGLWMASAGGRVFAARAGMAGGRGAVEALEAAEIGGGRERWGAVATLTFGAELWATATDVRARSLTGTAGPDGAIHLVWIAAYGDAADLGYTRLQR